MSIQHIILLYTESIILTTEAYVFYFACHVVYTFSMKALQESWYVLLNHISSNALHYYSKLEMSSRKLSFGFQIYFDYQKFEYNSSLRKNEFRVCKNVSLTTLIYSTFYFHSVKLLKKIVSQRKSLSQNVQNNNCCFKQLYTIWKWGVQGSCKKPLHSSFFPRKMLCVDTVDSILYHHILKQVPIIIYVL